jgi:hypothetical protein
MPSIIRTLSILLVLALAPGCRGSDEFINQRDSVDVAATPPASQPQESPPDQSPASAPAPQIAPQLDWDVETLLDKLERSAADLNAFTAKVTYQKEDSVLGRLETRTGELIYRLDASNDEKSFAILFEWTIINGRKRQDHKHYIFNGRWLAEIDHANKQFIKREIVAPGRKLDPLKLGEGPFPLPVGQPKAEVLARFDVTKAALPDAGLLKDLQNVDGLLLVPKPGTPESDEFAKVELFYDRQTLLPVGINTESKGDRKTIKLTEIRRNPELDEAALQKLNIQEPDPGEWRVDVRPWTARDERRH